MYSILKTDESEFRKAKGATDRGSQTIEALAAQTDPVLAQGDTEHTDAVVSTRSKYQSRTK